MLDNIYVKVSAPVKFMKDPEFEAIEQAAKDLCRARAGRAVMFASDLPHTRFEGMDDLSTTFTHFV